MKFCKLRLTRLIKKEIDELIEKYLVTADIPGYATNSMLVKAIACNIDSLIDLLKNIKPSTRSTFSV